MRFEQGCTRIVVLTETMAIKIALPFRPFLPIFILIREFFRGELQRKLKKHRGNLVWFAIRVATIGGIVANRREMRISREHPEYPIAPVLRAYFWGFIIVMPRGESDGRVLDSLCHWESLPAHVKESDLFSPANRCRFGNRFLFIDYGDPSADEALAAFAANHRP